jgi:YD repeat-containing protein
VPPGSEVSGRHRPLKAASSKKLEDFITRCTRLTQKTYPDTTSVEYAYDLAGKVQQVGDPTGTVLVDQILNIDGTQ